MIQKKNTQYIRYWSLTLTKNRFFIFCDKSELRVWKGLLSLWVNKLGSRERGQDGKSVVLMTSRFAWFGFNPRPGHVVASLDKTLYDDYLFDGFKQATNSVDKNLEKSTGISIPTSINNKNFKAGTEISQTQSTSCKRSVWITQKLDLTLSGERKINRQL